jgi:hypothetical protein
MRESAVVTASHLARRALDFHLAHFVDCVRPGVDLDSPVIAQLPQAKINLILV